MQTATMATSVRHLDAVERKPLYHYRPGSRVLTLASPGCSLRCGYCINYRMSQFGRESEARWTAKPVDPVSVVAQAAAEGASVGLSYTEPSLAIELSLALAEAGGPAGVALVWKTNGFMTAAARKAVMPVLAAVNLDLKAADEAAHQELTGGALAPVLDTLADFLAAGIWVEVSTPVIPGVNARPDQLATIASRIAALSVDVPWHLLRWTPGYRLADGNPTTPQALREASQIGRQAGLRHVYVERAIGPEGRNTACPGCERTLVQRGIWALEHTDVDHGKCPYCGHHMAGRW
jgi:pyruvate formate lyase activating enzyme